MKYPCNLQWRIGISTGLFLPSLEMLGLTQLGPEPLGGMRERVMNNYRMGTRPDMSYEVIFCPL